MIAFECKRQKHHSQIENEHANSDSQLIENGNKFVHL